jgi:hypothetical protein
MNSRILWAAGIALGASIAAHAQSSVDRSFTATGTSCGDVAWSAESLAKYPGIAGACQKVVQRDGKYYVNFVGKVEKVADGGKKVIVNFKGGESLTLTPPENLELTVNGRKTKPARLQRGDQLTFYIPQDRFTADFFETPTAPIQEIPIEPLTPPARLATPAETPAPATQPAPAEASPSVPTPEPAPTEMSQAPSTEMPQAAPTETPQAAPAPAATETPPEQSRRRPFLWLIAIVVIAAVIYSVMRNRKLKN